MGFVQVRLEVVAININNIAAFVRAGQASLNISSYYLSLSKSMQRLRADGILMPHLPQSPIVSGYFMRTFIADIIPKIQRFSQRLDDLTKLTNQHWVSLGDISQTKRVFIFRANNQLLISDNGIVEKGSWEYLGNQSLLLDTKTESYLLKHGFFDENVIALKLDSTDSYAFFVNETKYHGELNNIGDVLKFLENKYLKNNGNSSGLGSTQKGTINENAKYGYTIIGETEKYDLAWGNFIEYKIEFSDGRNGEVYKGGNSGKYFFMDITFGKKYATNFEQVVHEYHLYLRQKNNR